MDEDVGRDDHMGSATTDGNGYFTVSGTASDVAFRKSKRRPDVYIRLDYRHSSARARFEVDRSVLRGGKEDSHKFSDKSGNVNFGTLHFNTEMCTVYQRFYDATHDFYSRVGYRVPFDLKITAQAIINGGAPFALHDEIRIPKGKKLSSRTAKHELAHAVRHRYDGGLAHFLKDVAQFVYTRNHNCKSNTNHGFAFNEGWAEYWAGDTACGDANGTKKVEGNVATALKEMQTRCRTSDRNMWEVLRRNKGKIHSYSSYASKHRQMHNCS
ncbi:hypothetical protein BWQ96_09989 [Gracilariopsis chorda]|uniref:Uncharacterized protein n=1 Tax=Gracilariopsis chorda TaxID=448386 RepID=A0A2V3IE08_9FLOR|nr:hypothetical protein BWQ96_09989 [Gracilariopsis chorda]|eukprot:PXF40297.1 hypothetical protein BWQ96_09989 [Gracilariopsis chorda]